MSLWSTLESLLQVPQRRQMFQALCQQHVLVVDSVPGSSVLVSLPRGLHISISPFDAKLRCPWDGLHSKPFPVMPVTVPQTVASSCLLQVGFDS